MPEHAHVLLQPADGSDISRILYALKKPVTHKAIYYAAESRPETLRRMLDILPDGSESHHFWQQGPGYDRNVWSVEELHEKIHFTHNNPVRRGLVAAPGEWKWSSWCAWDSGVDQPVPIDRESLPPVGH